MWNWNSAYTIAWHETDDPRIVAVIQRDDYAESPDYDAQAPTFLGYGYGSRADTSVIGYGDVEAIAACQRAMYAYDATTGRGIAYRYLRAFHGITAHYVSSSIDQYSWAIVLDSPEWRAAMGIAPDAELSTEDIAGAVRAYLDGEVYGIGYAVIPGRVTDETEFDFDSSDVTMECWGFYGEDYARSAALAFESGKPVLPEMLEV